MVLSYFKIFLIFMTLLFLSLSLKLPYIPLILLVNLVITSGYLLLPLLEFLYPHVLLLFVSLQLLTPILHPQSSR